MSKAKVSWLLCIGRLVSKTDNVMHFACLVKQASVDLVSDLFVYYRLGYKPFVCSWGLHWARSNAGWHCQYLRQQFETIWFVECLRHCHADQIWIARLGYWDHQYNMVNFQNGQPQAISSIYPISLVLVIEPEPVSCLHQQLWPLLVFIVKTDIQNSQ